MPESSVIALRPATLADVGLLRYWDEQPQVVSADPNGLDLVLLCARSGIG